MADQKHSSDGPEDLFEPNGDFVVAMLEQIDLSICGGMNGYGLRDRDLATARKLMLQLAQLVQESPNILRDPEKRSYLMRSRAYRDLCDKAGVGGPHDDTAYIRFKYDRMMALVGGRHRNGSKKVRAEVEELYRLGNGKGAP